MKFRVHGHLLLFSLCFLGEVFSGFEFCFQKVLFISYKHALGEGQKMEIEFVVVLSQPETSFAWLVKKDERLHGFV